MAWYHYNWTSDLLPSKLKDKGIKRHIWKYVSSTLRQIIILRQTLGEKITNATLYFGALVFEKTSLQAVRAEYLCAPQEVFGVVLFVHVFVLMKD